MSLNIVLVEPEIPPNTGNVARLCMVMQCRLHLVQPLGFEWNNSAFRRAGMDYLEKIDVRLWPSLDALRDTLAHERFWLVETPADQSIYQASFQPNDFLLFGRETKGLPPSFRTAHADRCLHIPMPHPEARSLNLAVAVGITVGEALRQINAA